ncbi:hypothetical protein [Streptomyces sp. NPDC005898]|uniref:hypothetical protein n=1 Tax=Streptomyces sp. NPDC005898 TaxID=3157082 RepID=UPI0034053C76
MVGSFLYWSDRAIQRLAEDNGVELTGRARWTVGIGAGGLQAGLGGRERLTRNRLEEARRVRRALGRAVIEDFAMPPPAAFIQVTGRVSFAQFEGIYAKNPGALLHLQTRSPAGQRTDVCLFGSQDNVSGFGPWDDFEGGWISSEAPAVDKLLRAGDGDGPPTEDDAEALAVEALKIALHQGMTGTDEEHVGRPETRGYTVGHNGDCTVLARVYTDVVLEAGRWHFHEGDPLAGAERIIVGRPLWVRAVHPEATIRYADLRGGTRWRWLRRMRLLPRRQPRTGTAP